MVTGNFLIATPAWAAQSGVDIEAAGEVDFDLLTNITTASDKVKMVSDDLVMTCDTLVYNGETGIAKAERNVRLVKSETVITADNLVYNNTTGLVEASGKVTLSSKQGVFQTEHISYNVKTTAGQLGEFSSKIPGQDRDFLVTGKGATTSETVTEVNGASLTRCPFPKPEYQFSAKRIQIDEKTIRLEQVVLRLKGVPVFYFPKLSLNRDNKQLPRFDLGYDGDDGMKFDYDYTNRRSDSFDWRFHGKLTSQGDSKVGFGFGTHWGDLSNQTDIEYNFDGYAILNDTLKVNSKNYALVIDGSRDFSDSTTDKIGFELTRKYWESPIGSWQLGVLGRYITTTDGGTEYTGTYGGYKLEYRPIDNLTLGLVQLDNLNGNRQDWDYLEKNYLREDYQYALGSNLIYNYRIPINKRLFATVDGVYNFNRSSHPNDWIRQAYTLTSETCCFSTSLGWDAAENSIEFRWRIMF